MLLCPLSVYIESSHSHIHINAAELDGVYIHFCHFHYAFILLSNKRIITVSRSCATCKRMLQVNVNKVDEQAYATIAIK